MTERLFKEKIVLSPSICTGCRACELACSVRMKGYFRPHIAAINVIRDNLNGTINYHINENCDLCWDRKTPMCIEFCVPGALTLGRA